jgi:hypothetical protein
MYCSKCGEENIEGARFCMHCGADLSGYKVEISPKIEVSPKISVSAKAEGGVSLKWKKKPEGYVDVKEYGTLPVYRNFVELEYKPFCPFCGDYACLEFLEYFTRGYKIFNDEGSGKEEIYAEFELYHCLSCDKNLLLEKERLKDLTKFSEYLYVNGEKIPVYGDVAFRYSTRGMFVSGCYYDDKSASDVSVCIRSWYAYCPICKEMCGHAITIVTREKPSSFLSPISLWECETCGKFLASHVWMVRSEDLLEFYSIKAHPICNVCSDATGIYTCSVCGKRMCESCAITEKVKKGLLFKKTIKLCPNCAERK